MNPIARTAPWLALCALVFSALVCPRDAFAADPQVKLTSLVIRLDVPPADVPDVVCLVTDAKTAGWVSFPEVDWGLFETLVDDVNYFGTAPSTWATISNLAHPDWLCGSECRPKVDAGPLRVSNTRHYVKCVSNDAPTHSTRDDERRVLVAQVMVARPAHPVLHTFEVHGDLITAETDQSSVEDPTWTARTLGAHYMPQTGTSSSHANVIVLPLARSCTRHIVSAPPFIAADSRAPGSSRKFLLSIRGVGGESRPTDGSLVCAERAVAFDEGRAELMLPYNADERTLELDADPGDHTAAFRARWTDRVAPPVVHLLATKASFSWRVPCIAPRTACPAAILADVGVRCDALNTIPVVAPERPAEHPVEGALDSGSFKKEPVCNYVCPAAAGTNSVPIPFEIPSNVQFSDENDRLWTLRLGYANQELEGYVGPLEHSIVVNFSRWRPPPRTNEKDPSTAFDDFISRPWEGIDHCRAERTRSPAPPHRAQVQRADAAFARRRLQRRTVLSHRRRPRLPRACR